MMRGPDGDDDGAPGFRGFASSMTEGSATIPKAEADNADPQGG